MIDNWSNYANPRPATATRHAEVTPSDTEDLPSRPLAVYVLTGGDLALRMGGVDITYPVATGDVLSIRPERVLATGTTATVVIWD